MDTEKKPTEDSTNDVKQGGQNAPVDALSMTPDELEEEKAKQEAVSGKSHQADSTEKKVSPVKQFLRKINVYFLFFVLLCIVAGIVMVVSYFNSQKPPKQPDIASRSLNQDELKQLANNDASVGDSAQTLTIQGNAIINGQSLFRGNVNVAGKFQAGESIQGPSLTISGASNLNTAQINTLQVAQNIAVQGTSTLRDLNVSGASSFSGGVTASQLTVTKLIISGNGSIQIPNHVSFSGPKPSRTINSSVLGSGGSASVDGSDTGGSININTGNNPTAGCFATIKFYQSYTSQPHVIVTPVGAAAGSLQFYVEQSNSEFRICSANAAAGNASFAFNYFVSY